jgi:endonuclease/exonuclease/phosphatase family metal-dependent hydrolase
LLVRTWNLFHGNASPPERKAFLEEMIRLVVSDRPGLVCLQELPVWSLSHLDDWTEMTAVADVARRPMLGPFPATPEVGRVITDVHHGLFRSAFTGQANAVLVAPGLRVVQHRYLVLNPWSFRRRFDIGTRLQLAWARERRICQVLRLAREDVTLVVTNLHATSHPDRRLADAEVLRAATFVDGFAEPDEPIVLAGDFNLTVQDSRTLGELTESEWGFEGPTSDGVDHILVRRLDATPPTRWPVQRRAIEGRVLSDHAPLERGIA